MKNTGIKWFTLTLNTFLKLPRIWSINPMDLEKKENVEDFEHLGALRNAQKINSRFWFTFRAKV